MGYIFTPGEDTGEVFFVDSATAAELWDDDSLTGWAWWWCEPGYLPGGEVVGPFDSREEAEQAFYEELAEQRAARRDHDAWTAALAGELADE